MKRWLQLIFISVLLISCNGNSDKVLGDIKIDLYEAVSNPDAYNLIVEIEKDHVLKTMDTSLKHINILDNDKYHPLTSRLLVYNKMGEYHADSVMMRECPCGFCAWTSCEGSGASDLNLIDSILRNNQKLSGKYDLFWSKIMELSGEVYFLSVLARNNLKVAASDIKEMIVEDYSSKKLMSYPIFDYVGRQAGKKVLSVKWNDRTSHKIDSVFGKTRSLLCVVTINDHSYIAGELDTLNSGVTLRDVNLTDGLLDSLGVYFHKK